MKESEKEWKKVGKTEGEKEDKKKRKDEFVFYCSKFFYNESSNLIEQIILNLTIQVT